MCFKVPSNLSHSVIRYPCGQKILSQDEAQLGQERSSPGLNMLCLWSSHLPKGQKFLLHHLFSVKQPTVIWRQVIPSPAFQAWLTMPRILSVCRSGRKSCRGGEHTTCAFPCWRNWKYTVGVRNGIPPLYFRCPKKRQKENLFFPFCEWRRKRYHSSALFLFLAFSSMEKGNVLFSCQQYGISLLISLKMIPVFITLKGLWKGTLTLSWRLPDFSELFPFTPKRSGCTNPALDEWVEFHHGFA